MSTVINSSVHAGIPKDDTGYCLLWAADNTVQYELIYNWNNTIISEIFPFKSSYR